MSGNYSDSDDYQDDLVIMASQGLLRSDDCLMVLSPIIGPPSYKGKKKVQVKRPATQNCMTKVQTTNRRKLSLSKSSQNTSSSSQPIPNRPKSHVSNFGDTGKKSLNVNISKTLFSSLRTKENKSNKLEVSSQSRSKEVKEKKQKSKKAVGKRKKRKNIFSLESDNDSSDLEDPTILKNLAPDSLDNSINTIDETLSEDDILNVGNDDIPAIDSALPSTRDSLVIKSGPRHSSPIKTKTKRPKIFDSIRQQNALMKSSQDSVVISDSETEFDYSQSFVKCSQEYYKTRITNKKSAPKRPRLSLKTAAVSKQKESISFSSPDLNDPSVSSKRVMSVTQNNNSNNDNNNNNDDNSDTNKTDQMLSDEDLFSSGESTEIFGTESTPMVVRKESKKPYDLMKISESTIEYIGNEDDTQSYSLPDDMENVSTDNHKDITSQEVPVSITSKKEEKTPPVPSKILTSGATNVSRDETVEIDSLSFLTKETSSSISMPNLSPQTSLIPRQDLSSDISLPQLSQCVSVSDLPQKDVSEKNLTVSGLPSQMETGSTATCSSYSLEEEAVPVFDSEDEELFMTQSAIDRSVNVSPEIFVVKDEITEEERLINQENMLWWDNMSNDKSLKKSERLGVTEDCGGSTSLKNSTNKKKFQDDCIETIDNETAIETHTVDIEIPQEIDAADDDISNEANDHGSSDTYEPVLDSDGNMYFTVKLNIYRDPTPDDFKHILYPEESSNINCGKKTPKLSDKNEKGKDISVDLHFDDLDNDVSSRGGEALSLDLPTTSGTSMKIKISDSSVTKDKEKNTDSADAFGLPTRVCEGKGESNNVDEDVYLAPTQMDYQVGISSKEYPDIVKKEVKDDPDEVDDDVYLAQTQIDYWVISSDEECNDEGKPVANSPALSPSIHDSNDSEDDKEPLNDFEDDIELLDVKSAWKKKETIRNSNESEIGHESDVYMMATQIGGSESDEEIKGNTQPEVDSDSQLYMMATQIDRTLSIMVDSDLDGDDNVISPDKGERSPPINEGDDDDRMDPYLVDTQIDNPMEIEEMDPYTVDTQIDPVEEDPYEVATLEMSSPFLDVSSEEDEKVSDEGETQKETDDSSHVMKAKEVSDESHGRPSSTGKFEADASSAKKIKLTSRISEDDGVSENNIVEYMLSTQVDASTSESKNKSAVNSTKTWKVSKVPTVRKSLFENFSESSGIQSPTEDQLKKHIEKPLASKDAKCPGNLFSIFMPGSSSNNDGKVKSVDKEENKKKHQSVSKQKEGSKESSMKKSEVYRKIQEVAPKWMTTKHSKVEKLPNSSDTKTKRGPIKNAKQVGTPSNIRKRKMSNKSMEESLSSKIASAKKAAEERSKFGGALPKHLVGKDTPPKQLDLSDVEMPNTQEIIEQGLPILNRISPIVKRPASKDVLETERFESFNKSKRDMRKLPITGSSSSQYSSSSTSTPSPTLSLSSKTTTSGPRSLPPSSSSSSSSLNEEKSSKAASTAGPSISSSSTPLSVQSESPIQQRQPLTSTNQEILIDKNQAALRKLPPLSKSIYLHKNKEKSISDVPISMPVSTNLTPDVQVTSANTDENRVKGQNSARKMTPLPKSVYLYKGDSSSGHQIPISVSSNAPSSGTGAVSSTNKTLSLLTSPISISNSQQLITTHSSSSSLLSSSSTPMSISTGSEMRDHQSSSVPKNTQASTINPSISASSTTLPSSNNQTQIHRSVSTTITSTNNVSTEMAISSIPVPRNPTASSTPRTTSGLTVSTKNLPSLMDISLAPPSTNPIASSIPRTFNTFSEFSNKIPTPLAVSSAPPSVNPVASGAPRTTNASSVSTTTNNAPIVSSALPPAKLPISATPRSYGPIMRKPKQLKKGILKIGRGNQPRMKSTKVHFDESRNMVKLIEKVDARPPLLRDIDSTTKKIWKEPFRTQNTFIQKLLIWSPSWIKEQASDMLKGQPPPVVEPNQMFNRLRMSYDDVRSYQEITYKLFLLEVWAMLSHDYDCYPRFLPAFIKSKPQYLSNGDEGLALLTMEVEGVTNDPKTIPMVSDVLVLAMRRKVKDQETIQPFEQFGFVEGIKKSRFEHSRNSILCRPEIRGNFKEFLKPGSWVFSVTIKVRFKGCVPFDLMQLRKIFSLTTALRQFQGLVEFAQAPLCPALMDPDPMDVVFSQDEHLEPDENLLKYLNKEQAGAVTQIREAVLRYPNHPRVCLLQGPPGTGKSFSIMVLIHQILLNTRFQAKICLAAPSNAAVDEMASRLIDLSEKKCKPGNKPVISLVRLGNIDSVSSQIKKFHIWSLTDERLHQDQLKRMPKSLQNELKAVDSRISSLIADLDNTHICDAEKVSKKKELERLRSQDKKKLEEEMKPCYEDRRRAKYSVISDCHVVCGTLSSFGSGEVMPLLRFKDTNHNRRDPFTCLIVDEATQAVEMDCLIPLQHHISKLVLVGDQEQLPATVLSQEAKNCRFDSSLFQRLHDKFESCKEDVSTPVMMLKEQYRMHPEILKLPNSYFYRNLLTTARPCIKLRTSDLSPYLVFDILDGIESSGNSGSKSNKKEATCVALLCQHVVSLIATKNTNSQRQKKIGVICPYTDQKRAIRDSLGKLGLYNIVVNTVDGFQGQEKDVIILSCVRAQGNPQSVGFVDDSKRMNVSLTRAKLAMYIVGHGKTLGTSDLWKLLYQDAKDRGLLVTVPRTDRFAEIASKRVPLPKPQPNRR